MNMEDLKQRLQSVVAAYPHPQAALAPLLHEVFELKQPLDNETLTIAAELCEVDVRSVAEIVAYYPVLQNGHSKYTNVCFGLPCYLNGAKEIFETMKTGLSPDGSIKVNGSIKEVTMSSCLGHCYAAPVVTLEDGTVCRATLSTSNNQVGAKHG